MKKSIIIPCYNEINNIAKVIDKVLSKIEEGDNIIIVDDGSSDGTAQYLANLKNEKIKIILNSQNFGKGFALRTAFKNQENLKDLILIQDADLEYNPDDYEKLLLPFYETNADIVYGSRFLGGSKYQRIHFFWHYLANKILTFITNIFTNLNMTDMETGYKVFKKSVLDNLNLKENSFGIEPEITVKMAKKKLKFYEVPVSYAGRSYEEGKKIRLKDAFIALYCIIKYSFTN
jgi:glycosyltransferase involved in cell wall biosynthesis|tara:strand:- start:48 stop:743 length:696 start_codon:yes stop_codon:yes gene_type:complete